MVVSTGNDTLCSENRGPAVRPIVGTEYTQTAVQLAAGDLLMLYTDGISEARDDHGEQLGLDRLLQMAAGLPADSAAVAGEALLAALARFRRSGAASDDETGQAVAGELLLGGPPVHKLGVPTR